jgi:alpha-methylacyl-CoA racemase
VTPGDAQRGPLHGIKILEFGGIGPNPLAGMLFADMGADVLRLDRKTSADTSASKEVVLRGRATVHVDLKSDDGREFVLSLCDQADALIEGFRPGVMERLGLGPDVVLERNPRLVFGRVTGYGQDGPMAMVAGHDVNYISIAGVLGAIQRKGDRPMFPLNLVGDYGGGTMFLAFGVLCALLEATKSGRGQVVDAAMVDGASVLCSLVHGMRALGDWSDEPGVNLLDSGAHFYETYETKDGKYVAVGALEPQFYGRLLELLELSPEEFPQYDRARWPELKLKFAGVFAGKTRDEWTAILESEEACATPVLGFGEAQQHAHMQARGVLVEIDGVMQPAAAPRLGRTPGAARPVVTDSDAALERWGVDSSRRAELRSLAAIA